MPHILSPTQTRYEGSETQEVLRNQKMLPGLELVLRLTQLNDEGEERPVVGTVALDHNKELFTPEGWTWLNGTPIQLAQNIGLSDEYVLLDRGVFSNRPVPQHPGLHAEPVLAHDEAESYPGYSVHRLITPDGIFEALKAGEKHKLRLAYIAREIAPKSAILGQTEETQGRSELRLIA